MRLMLIRHGQTPANVAGILDTGAPGPGLTALGYRQAEALPGALQDEAIDAIYISTLRRTALTAQPLAAALALEPSRLDGVHEIEAGALEGRSDREAVLLYLGTVFAWAQGDLSPRMPGGGDGHEFAQRFDGDTGRAAGDHPTGTAVVFSHGAAIRTWCGLRARNADAAFAAHHELDNTAMVILEGDPVAGWFISSWSGDPVGGGGLSDDSALDPAGEAL